MNIKMKIFAYILTKFNEYSQVGRGPHTEAGDSRTETGDAQLGGGNSAVVGEGVMAGLGAPGWDYGGRKGYWRRQRYQNVHNNKRQRLRL